MSNTTPSPSFPRAAWLGVALLGLVTTVFAVGRFVGVSEALAADVVPANRFDARYVEHPVTTYVHIIGGSVFMILGPLQFLPAIRRRWLWLHRASGRLFVLVGAAAGISALVMSQQFPALGGLPTQSATLLFGTFFLISLAKAVYHVRRRQIALHREWMIRAFALGLAVSTIRFYVLLFDVFSDFTFEEAFGTTFWLAFTTHAVVAELWIQRTRGVFSTAAGS